MNLSWESLRKRNACVLPISILSPNYIDLVKKYIFNLFPIDQYQMYPSFLRMMAIPKYAAMMIRSVPSSAVMNG